MLTIILWVTIGLVIGWNLPQPVWAQNVQDVVTEKVKKITRKFK